MKKKLTALLASVLLSAPGPLVLGAGGFGKPVRDACHRPERYAERAGLTMDAPVTPEAAARVIRAEGCGDRLFVNQVEDEARYRLAAELAGLLSCPVSVNPKSPATPLLAEIFEKSVLLSTVFCIISFPVVVTLVKLIACAGTPPFLLSYVPTTVDASFL